MLNKIYNLILPDTAKHQEGRKIGLIITVFSSLVLCTPPHYIRNETLNMALPIQEQQ